MAKAKLKHAPQTFTASLEKGDRALGWTIARVPFAPGEVWTAMVRMRVKGTLSVRGGAAFAFRTSLFPEAGTGKFYLLVNRAMQEGSGARLGVAAEFSVEPDMDERPAELPDELAVLLEDEPGLMAFYEGLTEYSRRELGKWVLGVKSDEARMRRAEQAAERLLFAMEGERELPPVIAAAFRVRPKARLGWEKMTELQRRNELMAVGYYQSPEARTKRVGKLVELAEKRAG